MWLGRAVDECDQLMMPITSYAFFDELRVLRSDPGGSTLSYPLAQNEPGAMIRLGHTGAQQPDLTLLGQPTLLAGELESERGATRGPTEVERQEC